MKKLLFLGVLCLYSLGTLSQNISNQESNVKKIGITPLFGTTSSEALYLHTGVEIDYHVSQCLSVYANYHLLFLQIYEDEFSVNDPMQTTSIGLKVDVPSNHMAYFVGFSYNQLTKLPENYIEGFGMDLGLTYYILQSDWYDFGVSLQETYIPESQKGLSQAQFLFRFKF